MLITLIMFLKKTGKCIQAYIILDSIYITLLNIFFTI